MLGLVLRAATGTPLADYLSEKVWKPMGAEADASWLVDKGGFEAAFTGLNATVRDYGRFGQLLGYGYQTWVLPARTRQFVLRGVRRQALFVDPVAKVVMVHTAAGAIGDPGFMELLAVWDGVLATVARAGRER